MLQAWLARLAEFQLQFSSWETLKGNSPSDAHAGEAKAAAAAGPCADLEAIIFKPPEEQLLAPALFNHHHQELVDNYGKKPRRGRKRQLEQTSCLPLAHACTGQSCPGFLNFLSRLFKPSGFPQGTLVAVSLTGFLAQVIAAVFFYQLSSPDRCNLFKTSPIPPLKKSSNNKTHKIKNQQHTARFVYAYSGASHAAPVRVRFLCSPSGSRQCLLQPLLSLLHQLHFLSPSQELRIVQTPFPSGLTQI